MLRDKKILNTKPSMRVITEKNVNIATALNSLMLSPLKLII